MAPILCVYRDEYYYWHAYCGSGSTYPEANLVRIVSKMCNKSPLVGKFKLSDGYVDYYCCTVGRLREECTKRNLGIGQKKNMVNRSGVHDRQSRGGT